MINDDIISNCVVNEKLNILTIKGQDDAVTEINISIDNNGNTINGEINITNNVDSDIFSGNDNISDFNSSAILQLNNNIIIKELQLNENDNNKDDIIITHDNSYIDELYSIQTTENSNINIDITDGKIPFTESDNSSSESVILKNTKININFNNAINGDYGIEKDGIKLGSDITINKVNSGIYDHNKQFEYENHTYKIHGDYNDVVLENASDYADHSQEQQMLNMIGEKLIVNP